MTVFVAAAVVVIVVVNCCMVAGFYSLKVVLVVRSILLHRHVRSNGGRGGDVSSRDENIQTMRVRDLRLLFINGGTNLVIIVSE
jgi:hypothetical protein